MSEDNISKLYTNNPFPDKMEIAVEDIVDLYIPFDSISETPIESQFLDDFKKENISKFYGLTGNTGFGKSSTLNYLLVQLSNDISNTFCIKLNEFPDEIKGDPKILLKDILRKIFRISKKVNEMDKNDRDEAMKLLAHSYSYTSSKRKSITAGIKAKLQVIPLIFGLDADVRGQLESQSGTTVNEEATIDDLIEFLNYIVDIIESKGGFKHVLIMIDEMDKITSPESTELSSDQAIKFFSKMLPVLSKTKCSYVFALNSKYNSNKFQEQVVSQYFDHYVSIPKLKTIENVTSFIKKRTEAVCGSINLEEIWENDGLVKLFDYYKQNTLRHLMIACKFSILKAWKAESAKITSFHVKDGIMEIPT